MSFCNSHKLFIFTLFFSAFILPIIISLPVSDLPYENFIAFLIKNNCSMPKELELPFTKTPDPSPPFSYLSAPLSECKKPEVIKEFHETHMLCTEVFDVLKNVTCGRYESLPTIESSHLSANVCHDFANLKYNLPKNDNYLSGRLSDKVICKVLCTAEKYESLCKTLLWSYETLMKMDIALSNKEHDKETGTIHNVTPAEEILSNECQTNEFRCNVGQCVSIELKCNHKYDCPDGSDEIDCVALSVKSNPASVESQTSSQITKEPDKSKTVDNLQSDEHNALVSNRDQTDQKPHNPGDILQDVASKKDSPDMKVQTEAINKTAIESISTSQNKSESNNQKLTEISGSSVKPVETEKIPNLNPQPEHMDNNENKNDVSEELLKKEANDNNSQTHLDATNLTLDINGVNHNQKIKNATMDNMLSTNDKADINSDVGAKSSGKSEKESVAPATIAENDNELKSNNFPEEDSKPKTKQTDFENQEVKENEKPKQTDYESPNELMPDSDSKLPEPPTQSTLPDEDVEHQEDKESDQYNDIGNEGDYAKSDYDNSFKNKESDVKSSIAAAGTNQMTNGFENNISPQNIGRISEEIAMIAPYPEQEDSHFFFYFLTIVLIIMAGYLVFHNKQKIIALIVEGRHERRRRSHGAGYKKLETK